MKDEIVHFLLTYPTSLFEGMRNDIETKKIGVWNFLRYKMLKTLKVLK